MVLKVLLFLAAILALTIGAHLLLYRALIRLFMIDNSGLRFSLLVILLLLSFSFMAAFFILQWQENSLTVGFYKFSAIWTALFLNLLLAVLLSWLIIAAIWIAGTYPNTRLIAAACLTLAVFFTGYGVWNAFHPRIKKLVIEFENLPDRWKGRTIVQLSDVHLGHFHGEAFLNHLVRSVNALNPELVFITGDLFDGMAKNISHFAAGLNHLKAREGIYFVTGNHETYIGVHRASSVLTQTHIRILKNEVIDLNGLQVIGISYPGIKEVSEIKGLEKLRQNSNVNGPRILLFHTPTNIIPRHRDGANQHFSTYWIPDTTYSAAQNLGVDLQLSGHTHAGQLMPFGSLTKLIYKGFEYGLRRLSNFSIYTTSGVGTWGPPMRTGNFPEIVELKLQGIK
jgi:predicted MPP superfamily phosphohydrolase